jgi:hypothetical protein
VAAVRALLVADVSGAAAGRTSLGIMTLATGQVTTIERVANFQIAEDSSTWLAYHRGNAGGGGRGGAGGGRGGARRRSSRRRDVRRAGQVRGAQGATGGRAAVGSVEAQSPPALENRRRARRAPQARRAAPARMRIRRSARIPARISSFAI